MINKPLKIIVADDNRFFCEAMQDSLNQHNEFEASNFFTNLKELIVYTNNNSFDLLILDVNFNGESSLDFLHEIKNSVSTFKIIALTTMNNNYIKNKALENGVDLFIGKDSDLSLFKDVILNCYKTKEKQIQIKSSKIEIDDIVFTKRKLEILQAFYKYSNKTEKELSDILNISESAIKSHKQSLFVITNSKNTQELIKFGIQKGLIVC